MLSAQLQALGRPPLPPRGSTAARMPARMAGSVVVGRGAAAAPRPPAAGAAGPAPRARPAPAALAPAAAAFWALVLRTELGRMPICEPVVGPQAMKRLPVIRLPSASRGASGVEGGNRRDARCRRLRGRDPGARRAMTQPASRLTQDGSSCSPPTARPPESIRWMPPSPSLAITSYGPRRVPGARLISSPAAFRRSSSAKFWSMTITCSAWGAWAVPSGISTATRLPSGARSQSRAAERGDPHAGFVSDEGVAVHGVADGHQLVAGLVHQLVSGARPVWIGAATIGDLPLAALAGGRRGKRADIHFISVPIRSSDTPASGRRARTTGHWSLNGS